MLGVEFGHDAQVRAASIDSEEGDTETGEVMWFHAWDSRGDVLGQSLNYLLKA